MNRWYVSATIITIFAFVCGIFIGYYKIIPFDKLEILEPNLVTPNNQQTNPKQIYDNERRILERISINSEEELQQKRHDMINYVWMGSGFPTKNPENIELGIKMDNFDNIKNLEKVDKFTILMDFGKNENKFLKSKESEMVSTSYLFHAKNQKNDLIIYHQGHAEQSISDSKNVIQFFLDNGYSVLVFSMPMREGNNEPIVDTINFGKLKLATHNHLTIIDNEFFHPIKFFIEPITVTLNYIEKNYDYQYIHMMGISGGGWTTIVYSALDPRISHSYPIAGAFPFYMRHTVSDLGDYEQTLIDFYEIVSYEELFVMDGYGENRKSIQFFNYNDPCCFQAEIYSKSPYGKIVNEKLTQLGLGQFDVILDKSAKKHEVTNFALEKILSEIEN